MANVIAFPGTTLPAPLAATELARTRAKRLLALGIRERELASRMGIRLRVFRSWINEQTDWTPPTEALDWLDVYARVLNGAACDLITAATARLAHVQQQEIRAAHADLFDQLDRVLVVSPSLAGVVGAFLAGMEKNPQGVQ